MLGLFPALMATAMAALPLPITGASSCPDAAAVERALLRLLPEGPPSGYALRLALDGFDQDELRMELRDPSGRIVSERWLPTGPSCAGVAEELAVIAATWLGDLPPQVPIALPQPPAVVAAPAPPRANALLSAFAAPRRWSVGLGTGLASPGVIWITQAFALETRWLFGEPSGLYVGAGAFGTWPRPREFDGSPAGTEASWYRIRFVAEAGGFWQWGGVGAMVGGGVGGGWMVERSNEHADFHHGDGVLMTEGRVSYTLESLSAVRLWLGARGSVALNYDPAGNWAAGATPNSRYEGALLAGCDFFLSP